MTHGCGAPTRDGYLLGQRLIASGLDVATVAFEIVARGLVAESE
jgi:hypothetical protein